MQPVGPDTARELLEKSLDPSEVDSLQLRIDEHLEAGPFAFLHNQHADDIRRLLQEERPQTIAVVAAQLPPDLAAQVLAGFTAPIQTDILACLARLGPTDLNVLEEIATLLKQQLSPAPIRKAGLSMAVNVLRESTRQTTRTILSSMVQKDEVLTQSLRQGLFIFEDINQFDEASLRFVLQKTDRCRWAIALKRSSESLREYVLTCLSPPLAEALSREMNSIGPMQLSEITSAQSEIINIIMELEANHEVELSRALNRTRNQRHPIRSRAI